LGVKRFRSTGGITWRLVGIGLVIVWLLAWEWIVQPGRLRRDLIFPPSAILDLLYQSLVVTGELRTHLWATVGRLIAGLLLGAVPALLLGLLMGRNDSARLGCGPLLAVLGLIPAVAASFMFIILFGVGDFSKWTVVSAAVFFPILYCTTIGVRSSRAGSLNPTDWPYGVGIWIFTGLKLGAIVGLATLLAAEGYSSLSGLGFVIFSAITGRGINFPRFYLGMAAAALVAYALWLCIAGIELLLVRNSSGGSRLDEHPSGEPMKS